MEKNKNSKLNLIIRKVLSEQVHLINEISEKKSKIIEIQRKLVSLGYNLGNFGKERNGVDGVYGKLTKMAVQQYQKKNGIKPTGWVGPITAKSLGVQPLGKNKTLNTEIKPTQTSPVKVEPTPTPPKKVKPTPLKDTNFCVGLDKEMCDKVSSTSLVEMGDTKEAECAKYVTKCLSQYDSTYLNTGNAWTAAGVQKETGGKEKFNMYSEQVPWDKIWSEIKSLGWTRKDCQYFATTQESKPNTDKSRKVYDILINNIPNYSADISKLEVGDIVGSFRKSSPNHLFAFCQRMINDLKLDDKGNFKQLPITYNTHVGFVTTIKNGVPIIAHNVHGTYYTQPATQWLGKGQRNMLVWAVTDPEVNAAAKENKVEFQRLEEPTNWEKINRWWNKT